MEISRYVLLFLLVTMWPMHAAVNRLISIQAPAEAVAGSTISVTVKASTDASDGEQIGAFDVEYSVDEGKTWAQLDHAGRSGGELSRSYSFAVNANGGKAVVRGRVAFTDGAAGDVDYKGDAIQWSDTWVKWRSPPAKYAVIQVPAPPPMEAPPAPPEVPVVKRTMSLEGPLEAAPGSTVTVAIHLSTEANDGERIWFPHVAYSIDNGKTWTQLFYLEKAETEVFRKVKFKTNPDGGRTLVRIRAAFRGGAAGDVDHRGGAMQWYDVWEQWRAPQARYLVILEEKS